MMEPFILPVPGAEKHAGKLLPAALPTEAKNRKKEFLAWD
jgi:hypothetical protein